jgi:hypothetical protein
MLPHCMKCRKNGKECPGYNDHKPLQWVANGVVTSRRGKKDSTANKVKTGLEPEPFESATTALALGAVRDKRHGDNHWNLLTREKSSNSTEGKGSVTVNNVLQNIGFRTTQGVEILQRIFAIGGRSKLEEVVATRNHEKAATMVKTSQQPLKILESVLALIHTEQLPNYSLLSDETSEVVQAVNYCKFGVMHGAHMRTLTEYIRESMCITRYAKDRRASAKPDRDCFSNTRTTPSSSCDSPHSSMCLAEPLFTKLARWRR